MKSANRSRSDKKIVHTNVVEKLTHALHILATGKGDARRRVRHAYLACRTLTRNDFPPGLVKDWELIRKVATRFGGTVDEMSNVVAVRAANKMRSRQMNSTAAAKLAQQIWRLYWAVSDNVEYR